MSAVRQYHAAVTGQLRRIVEDGAGSLEAGAVLVAQALVTDHWIHLFGTGHSHLVALEAFYRAGGLVRAVPVLDEALMLHRSASGSTAAERRTGFAAEILGRYPVAPGDVLVVASHSGRNAVPVEMALLGRERGLRVIAITSRDASQERPARHPSGSRLLDAAEVVLDTGIPPGDAGLMIDGMAGQVGPTSGVVGAFVIQVLLLRAMEIASAGGRPPETYASSNAGGEEHNARWIGMFRDRIRHL